jgi:two-component system, NtrC family, sensor kinase
MSKWPLSGLQTQIAIALAGVLVLFIVVTELTITKLTRAAMTQQTAVLSDGGDPVSSEAVHEVSQKLLSLRKLVLFYLIVGVVLVLALGALVVHGMVIRPLKALSNALTRVGEGRLNAQMPLKGAREFVEIGGAFNQMTRKLADQKAALEAQLQQIADANQELAAAQERLIRSAKLASVGTLAAGVAHEIGNPLAGLLGLLEAVQRDDEKENETRYLNLMKSEIQRIDRIIQDLLSFARAPVSARAESVPADVGVVLDGLRPLLRAQRIFDGIVLEERLAPGKNRVDISHDDLTQVLLNLLLNAAEAMNGDGRIVLETEFTDNWRKGEALPASAIRIHITDSGPGIEEAVAAKIFDPFFTQKEPGKGTGLGLSICHNLCDRAGGEIILDSVYNQGARFTVMLPRSV